MHNWDIYKNILKEVNKLLSSFNEGNFQTFQGMRDEAVAKFQGFMLVAEPAIGNTAIQSPTSLGTFQLVSGDAMTKFSHKCSHSIEATSSMNKEHITVKYIGARTIKPLNTDAKLRQSKILDFWQHRGERWRELSLNLGRSYWR